MVAVVDVDEHIGLLLSYNDLRNLMVAWIAYSLDYSCCTCLAIALAWLLQALCTCTHFNNRLRTVFKIV